MSAKKGCRSGWWMFSLSFYFSSSLMIALKAIVMRIHYRISPTACASHCSNRYHVNDSVMNMKKIESNLLKLNLSNHDVVFVASVFGLWDKKGIENRWIWVIDSAKQWRWWRWSLVKGCNSQAFDRHDLRVSYENIHADTDTHTHEHKRVILKACGIVLTNQCASSVLNPNNTHTSHSLASAIVSKYREQWSCLSPNNYLDA